MSNVKDGTLGKSQYSRILTRTLERLISCVVEIELNELRRQSIMIIYIYIYIYINNDMKVAIIKEY